MIRRCVKHRFTLIAALSLLLLITPARPALVATGQLLRNDTGLYPRALRLGNGVVVASVVSFDANGSGLGVIYQSTDDGSTFHQIGTVADPLSANGGGLCCASLFELPRPVGALPAGTLLWVASVGQSSPNRRMSLRIWRSADQGRNWSLLSSCRTAPNTGGLWEPEFSVDAAGRLVCHFADETRPAQHSQLLARTSSIDGVNWSAPIDTVALSVQGQRPGMPTIRRLPDGSYFMVYEACGVPGQFDCAARFRSSVDGSNWGNPGDIGSLIAAVDGSYFTHAPVVAWAATGTPRGRLLVIGQQLRLANGSESPDSGRIVLINTEGGLNSWFAIPAPVAVPAPANNFCPNYSSALLPSIDGKRLLEIASDWDGSVCKPYYATGSAIGSGDAAGN